MKNPSETTCKQILQRVEEVRPKGKTKLIAIDGRGGSGKSTIAAKLLALNPELKMIPVDAFPCTPEEYPLHPLGTQTRVNCERLRNEAILPLFRGEDAEFVTTPWWKDQPIGPQLRISGGGTVIFEGCYSLHRQLRELYDLRIWVECPIEVAIENAVGRDGEDIRIVWTDVYYSNESAYIESHDPQSAADIIVRNLGAMRFEIVA